MTYRGKILNGQVVLDEPVGAPDGTPVTVDVEAAQPTKSPPEEPGQEKSIWDALLELAGTANDLPADFAEEHDHYIHGTPKRNRRR
jgi:hypothetical protein